MLFENKCLVNFDLIKADAQQIAQAGVASTKMVKCETHATFTNRRQCGERVPVTIGQDTFILLQLEPDGWQSRPRHSVRDHIAEPNFIYLQSEPVGRQTRPR